MAKAKKTRWILGGSIIAIAVVGLSFINLGANTVYFYTPEEVVPTPAEIQEKVIKLGGMVQPGSVTKDLHSLQLDFIVTDFKGHDINVTYRGTPPDLFKEGQGVVVEGTLDDNLNMTARNLMVKHSEEYREPKDHANMDKELLEKSLFK